MEHGSASELRLGQKRRDSAQPLNCLKLHFEFVRLPLSVVGPRPTNEGLVVLGRHGRGSGQCHGPRCRRARRESSLTGFGFYSGFGIVGLFMLTLPWPRSRHLQWPRLLQHRLGLRRPSLPPLQHLPLRRPSLPPLQPRRPSLPPLPLRWPSLPPLPLRRPSLHLPLRRPSLHLPLRRPSLHLPLRRPSLRPLRPSIVICSGLA